MEMPTLQDIFYCMCAEKITSPELKNLETSFGQVLKIMTERKRIKHSAATKIAEYETEITQAAKCAGFEQGFAFAVKLLSNN